MREFLLRIKFIVDVLGSCGILVLPREHLDAILEGLQEEYGLVISVIKSKFEPLPIGEVEGLLLAHEARMKKFQKHFADSPSINVAEGYNSPSNSYNSSSNNFSSQNRSNYSGNRGDFNRGSGYSHGGSDSDRGGGYSHTEAMTLAMLEVVVMATEATVVMQIFSAKFASNLVIQQRCVIFAMILIFSQTHLSR